MMAEINLSCSSIVHKESGVHSMFVSSIRGKKQVHDSRPGENMRRYRIWCSDMAIVNSGRKVDSPGEN